MVEERVAGEPGVAVSGDLPPQAHGWITSAWHTTENNRRARYYTLTAAGRRQVVAEERAWERLSTAINLVLRTAEG
jgi:PadR family transcriptional regulator PadR